MNEKSFDTTNMVNGPLNLVRLIGEIDGISKIIYVFFDIHIRIKKCPEDYSIDIDKYIIREFNRINNDITYDFYIEAPFQYYKNDYDFKTNIYLNDIREMFYKSLKIDTESKKMLMSQFNSNLRVHLLDMRIVGFLEDTYQLASSLPEAYYNGNKPLIYSILEDLINRIETINKMLISEKSITDMKVTDIMQDKILNDDYLPKLIKKLQEDYIHNDIGVYIRSQINDIIKKFDNVTKKCNNLLDKMKKLRTELLSMNNKRFYDKYLGIYRYNWYSLPEFVIEYSDDIKSSILLEADICFSFVLLMDLYFLRRFLDKDYATHGIFYGGAHHSCEIIWYLVTLFGFKITHFNYSSIDSLDEINKKIKNSSGLEENFKSVSDIFYPPIFVQCVNMNNFPKDFM